MYVRYQGKKINFRTNSDDFGDGRPVLVFLHGAGGSGRHWLGQYRALNAPCNLMLLDLPGHGESEGPAPETVEGYADWLAGFLAAADPSLDPASVILVGHSMGGAVAMAYALKKHPLAALVLAATGARLKVSPMIIDFLKADPPPPGWVDAAAGFFYGGPLSDGWKELVTRELNETPRAVFLNDFGAANQWDAMDRVQDIGVPTLVISGGSDMATPEKYGRFLAGKIPGARFTLIPGAGHMLMIEAAAPFTEALLSFVKSIPPPAQRAGRKLSKDPRDYAAEKTVSS